MHQRIQATRPRAHRRQFGNCQRTEQRVDSPGDQHGHERHRGEPRRNLTWRAQDPHADGVAHEDRKAERNAQHPQQAAARWPLICGIPVGSMR